jgi:hypothetical protein
MLAKTKGYHGLTAIDKCISVNPNVNVQMLETVYEMVCGIEVWSLSEAWEELGKFHSRFCKKLMGIPNWAAMDLLRWNFVERVGEKLHGMDCKILVSDYVS